MAAHVYTALQQIEADIERLNLNLFNQLEPALSFSCWTEDLDLDEYGELRQIVELHDTTPLVAEDRLYEWVRTMKVKYEQVWQGYGEPRTREQWLEAKYGLLGD